MASLSYATAGRIAARELRSSRGKFAFVVLSVAIGVAALTGVRGFAASFRSMLLLRARSILSADLTARTSSEPTPAEKTALEKFSAQGTQSTQVIEMMSMASAPPSMDPLLVSLKAVDPSRYPFYGEMVLDPAIPLRETLTENSVAVGPDLLLRLHLNVGDRVKLGERTFRIGATVVDEPDRLSSNFAAGPRVLISEEALATTGLVAPGSRVTRRYLYKLTGARPEQARSDEEIAGLKKQLEAAAPEASVSDYREASAALGKGLDGATGLLSLMSLVALVLGAVGVAMAMRAHLAARLDSIAIMKALGARSGQIMKIYVLQTLLLGLAGGVAGVGLGLLVQMAFPLFLAKLFHITPAFHVDARSVTVGLCTGLLTTLLFTLPPLLDIRGVRPLLVLRRNVEASDDPFTERLMRKLRQSGVQIAASAGILLGLGLVAYWISDSRKVGAIFTVGLAGVLLVLLGMSALLLWLLKVFLRGTRLRLPSVLRHGLANLYRPGNPSAALLAALGLGVMQITAVYLTQRAVVGQVAVLAANNLPNMFLIDIAPREVDGLRTLLRGQPGVRGTPELLPVLSGRILAINGTPAAKLKLEHMPRRALNAVNLTSPPSLDQPPPGDKVVSGKWWTAQQAQDAGAHPLVAVGREQAERLHIQVGQSITFSAQDTEFTAMVAALMEADSQHAYSRAQYVLPSASLAAFPAIWYGGVHCDPTATTALERVLYQHYPTITVVNVAQTLETVRQVVLQITRVIQFLASFSIFAGIVILASAIAGTRYRRIREVVVLKTLGATRARIAAIFSVEFAVLGLVAGIVGVLFANLMARFVLVRALKFEYSFAGWLSLFALLCTAALTVAAGWLASHRVLGQKPLEVLREE